MANYQKKTFKTVEEWLEARKPYLGGSEVSSIVGLNHFQSRLELYKRKKGLLAPIQENNSMEMGHLLEPVIVELLERRAGYKAIKNTAGNLIYFSEDYPFAEASPDRIGYLPNYPKKEAYKCIIEIKSTQLRIDAEDLPASWICQVQWYMGITGIHHAVIAWLSQGKDFGYSEIEFSQEAFDYLVSEAKEFVNCLENNIEPEALTATDIDIKYPKEVKGQYSDTNEEVALACETYKSLGKQIKELEKEQKAAAETIKLAMQDSEGIKYGGLVLATYKAPADSPRFDTKRFESENPDIYAKYINMVKGSRRLNVK